jgi:hypothetical protein
MGYADNTPLQPATTAALEKATATLEKATAAMEKATAIMELAQEQARPRNPITGGF